MPPKSIDLAKPIIGPRNGAEKTFSLHEIIRQQDGRLRFWALNLDPKMGPKIGS